MHADERQMQRRQFLRQAGWSALGLGTFAVERASAASGVPAPAASVVPAPALPPGDAPGPAAGNVMVLSSSGAHFATVDNSGKADAAAAITDLIDRYAGEAGMDLYLAPGTYRVGQPIVVRKHNVSIQGYAYGFSWPRKPAVGKTTLLVDHPCRDAIQLGPLQGLVGFTLRNIAIRGQNGRTGVRPDISPEQNGLHVMEKTPCGVLTVDTCQFVHLTHGILDEHPESTLDVIYITDSWISECNRAIWIEASTYASIISRNGLHDMSDAVLHLRSTNRTDNCHKETVIVENTGWNPGRIVFDIDGFRGGTISQNAFMFNNANCQAFAHLKAMRVAQVAGNTWVCDGSYEEGVAQGRVVADRPGSVLVLSGCADCTVAGNTLTSFNPEDAVIRVEAHPETKETSRGNHLLLNRAAPESGKTAPGHLVELTADTEDNLVLLPMARRDRRSVADAGRRNEVCALGTVSV